ncbi:MAG TPA: M48 family metalloprotease, partial [Acidimicrobiales bacterium]|nr:M48 family metalloprotease [Acidimicrobiales bacterium]
MIRAAALVALAAVLCWPGRCVLVRARWTERAPRAAVVLWQALGLAVLGATLGAVAELVASIPSGPGPRRQVSDFARHLAAARPSGAFAPNDVFALSAVLIVAVLVVGGIVVAAPGRIRARARRRLLVDLVAGEHERAPGAAVLEHPSAAAFSLPGPRPRVVVSSGAIEVLSDAELDAVLAHERAHVRARH